eukprot:379190-Karenia_brevis.AAC.1
MMIQAADGGRPKVATDGGDKRGDVIEKSFEKTYADVSDENEKLTQRDQLRQPQPKLIHMKP